MVKARVPDRGRSHRSRPRLKMVVNLAAMRVEDWTEPWVWRPSEWPNQPLALNVVGNQHPPRAISPGNRFTPLFSFNGSSPGPTIRMRGDERLRVTLRNHLGPNLSRVPKGPAPDPFEVRPDVLDATFCRMQKAEGRPCDTAPNAATVFGHFDEFFEGSPIELVDTNCLSGHVNVPHGSHTTNLHTHGLHVEPGMNAERHRRRTTASCASCPRGDGPDTQDVDGCPGAAVSRRTSASARRTTNIRSATCSGRRAGRVRRRSRIRRARTGTTRTPTAPRTIRSPAASPASSSSKATWTMRSIGR